MYSQWSLTLGLNNFTSHCSICALLLIHVIVSHDIYDRHAGYITVDTVNSKPCLKWAWPR